MSQQQPKHALIVIAYAGKLVLLSIQHGCYIHVCVSFSGWIRAANECLHSQYSVRSIVARELVFDHHVAYADVLSPKLNEYPLHASEMRQVHGELNVFYRRTTPKLFLLFRQNFNRKKRNIK
jgi:hypothetical protein